MKWQDFPGTPGQLFNLLVFGNQDLVLPEGGNRERATIWDLANHVNAGLSKSDSSLARTGAQLGGYSAVRSTYLISFQNSLTAPGHEVQRAGPLAKQKFGSDELYFSLQHLLVQSSGSRLPLYMSNVICMLQKGHVSGLIAVEWTSCFHQYTHRTLAP